MSAVRASSISCPRMGRLVRQVDCVNLICETVDAAALKVCLACPAGQAIAACCPNHDRLARQRDAVPDAVVLLRALGHALREEPAALQFGIYALAASAEEHFGGDGDPCRLARTAQRCGLNISLRPWAIIRDAACQRFALREV